MIEPISWLTVIGLLLFTMIKFMEWWAKIHDDKTKRINEIDKEIDNSFNASDILRVSGKLRNKKQSSRIDTL